MILKSDYGSAWLCWRKSINTSLSVSFSRLMPAFRFCILVIFSHFVHINFDCFHLVRKMYSGQSKFRPNENKIERGKHGDRVKLIRNILLKFMCVVFLLGFIVFRLAFFCFRLRKHDFETNTHTHARI